MYLETIVARKRAAVQSIDRRALCAQWERAIAQAPPTRSLDDALRSAPRWQKGSVAIIGEMKKASPSKGIIRPQWDARAIAQAYTDAGVDAMSILTEEHFFLGSPDTIVAVRDIVSVPILRKDFLFDPLHVLEARAIGADAILLIAAMHTPQSLAPLMQCARDVGLDVLVEVHDDEEAAWVAQTDAPLIGVNNRDLRTFSVDLAVTERILRALPNDRVVVSESGIMSSADVQRVRTAGARAVLVGEQCMRSNDIVAAVHALVGR
ncbi:MAG: indole-3-glycerol phosphate synthase TrpC [Paenibacillaceae bacterium]|nr:indole-3-glycerol phosphate synthase TrpC [Paenibacillaceae bacterium]